MNHRIRIHRQRRVVRLERRRRVGARDPVHRKPHHRNGANEQRQRIERERHGVVRESVDVAGGKQRNDMRMLKARRELDLALESIGRNTGAELRRQQLHDDPAAEACFLGEQDTRHAAAAQLALDRVGVAECRLQLCAKIAHRGVRKRAGSNP
jgi:hypothetical protein